MAEPVSTLADDLIIPPPPPHAPTVGMPTSVTWWTAIATGQAEPVDAPEDAVPADANPVDTSDEEPSEDVASRSVGDWWRKLGPSRPLDPEPDAQAGPPAIPAAPGRLTSHVQDRRLRWVLRNGSAAAAGWAVMTACAGPDWNTHAVAACAIAPVAWTTDALVVGAGYAGWLLVPRVRAFLPDFLGPLARPLAFAACSEAVWAVRGQLQADITSHLAQWGAWSTLVGPLLTGSAAIGACVLLLERRARSWPVPARWIARIPASTIAAALLLYAPGTF